MTRGQGVRARTRATWRLLLAVALVLLAGPAFALGLGQITVKSQRGQPLLAEIAIVSSDPSELENLQARLASPETFARVGLEPPRGAVTGLQFTVALDSRGQPMIRVTSREPVDEALLTFLLEVDWGQGRLVREYSALIDAPRTVSAPAQPPIEAPAAAPSNAIVREPSPAQPASEQPAPAAEEAAESAAAAAQAPGQPPQDAAPSTAIEPSPAPAVPASAERAAQPVAAAPGDYGPVRVGDTLGKIARSVGVEGHSLDQVMLALLRANPEAFINGNVNMIRAGAVLRAPSAAELSQYTASEARAIVHEQIGQWRELRRPAEQPAAIPAEVAAGASTQAPAAQAQVADARLEIVPPSSKDARQAGTRSGTQAGGEGDMLQELQQTKETLAAREAEVQELKAQVAELEKLRQDQQQLIALKDGKLAEAQQALAARQAAAASGQPADPVRPNEAQAPVWPWAVAALLVVAALGWWFLRRRSAAPARPVFDTSRLAASVPAAERDRSPATPKPTPAGRPATPAAPAPAAAMPTWHAHGVVEPGPEPAPAAPVRNATPAAPVPSAAALEEPQVPAPAAAAPVDARAAGAPEPVARPAAGEAADAGHDRIELARAYLDLGDVDTARGLLEEVAGSGDAAARGEASRLLRELA